MIALFGARPAFVDIDLRTYKVDLSKIEATITSKTKAIMPVGLYGQCADIHAINAIASQHGLHVIEEATQSFGATDKGGRSCVMSSMGSTSFSPANPLGSFGDDGGALFTNVDNLAIDMREIRVHGQYRRNHYPRIGINCRLDTLQAAIMPAKFDRSNWGVGERQKVGARHGAQIAEHCTSITMPHIEPHNTSVFAQCGILVESRAHVAKQLNEQGIPIAVHYPVPLNLQPVFTHVHKPTGSFTLAAE